MHNRMDIIHTDGEGVVTHDDILAMEYARGMLDAEAAHGVEARMQREAVFDARVGEWIETITFIKSTVPLDESARQRAAAQAGWDQITEAAGLARTDVFSHRLLGDHSAWDRLRYWRYLPQTVGLAALVLRVGGVGSGSYALARAIASRPLPQTSCERQRWGTTEWCVPAGGAAQRLILPDSSNLMLMPGSTFIYAPIARGAAFTRAGFLQGDIEIAVNGARHSLFGISTTRVHVDLLPGRYTIRGGREATVIEVHQGSAIIESESASYGAGRALHAGETACIHGNRLDVQ